MADAVLTRGSSLTHSNYPDPPTKAKVDIFSICTLPLQELINLGSDLTTMEDSAGRTGYLPSSCTQHQGPTPSSPASPTKAHVTEPGFSPCHQPGPGFHFLPSCRPALSVAQLTQNHSPDSNPRSYLKVQTRLLPPSSKVLQRLPIP